MYEEFITQLCMYAKAIRILSKGYLPISLIPSSKVQEILNAVKKAIPTMNPDYDILIKRLHLYYDMKLVTFSMSSKFDNSVSNFHSTIYATIIDIVSDRNSTSSHCRSIKSS